MIRLRFSIGLFACSVVFGAEGATTAVVVEMVDRWTQATGAVQICRQAGFTVLPQHPAEPLPALEEVDLVLLGSFVSEHTSYSSFISLNSARLQEFVEQGGVLVQMTQADQTERAPAFLPEPLEASRGDTDRNDLWIVSGPHPLLEQLPIQGGQISIPTHLSPSPLNRPANWESLNFQSGFKVLLASDPAPSDYALLEAAHGQGRIVLTSLYLDKLYQNGSLAADPAVASIALQFFSNLRGYVERVRAGTAPAVEPTRPPEPLPFVPGSYTIVVLPDTQRYSASYPQHFETQTQWIRDNRESRNIVYVVHLGDIVNNNNPPQWTNAQRAMRTLDGHVPYAMAPGNHDYGDNGSANTRDTYFNEYFPYTNYVGWPSFGGARQVGRMDSTYHLFEAGGTEWLILALEWGPRNQTVAWANQIVESHPGRKVILITHAYLYFDNSRYDWAAKGSGQSWNPHAYGTANDPDGTNDGEELWRKLVSKHPGFVMTLNGHVLNDGLGRLTSWGDHTNAVHQMLVNFQMHSQGGEAYLRLLEFLPDGKTVQVRAYSPHLNRYKTDGQNQFILDLDPEPPGPPPDVVPAPLMFYDDFDRGIEGWTAVQPEGLYFGGPMRWQYDIVSESFLEQSNIYTDDAAASSTATAVMLINDTEAPQEFSYRARLTAGDDDGFGLIFGYQSEETFYRVTFSRQRRTAPGFPWNGWSVDRKLNGNTTVLFGDGSPGHVGSFTNTTGRPFAVTIAVSSANRLTLTVVDDPDGAPRVYRLVQNSLLPGPAAGQVGLMTWGMSGGAPRGFRAAGLQLEPIPLAGNPNSLSTWIPVIPPGGGGSASLIGGNGGQPLWSLALGETGPAGVLVESSDSYAQATDINGNSNIDFTGPTLVTGAAAWTNYTLRVRVLPGDDDAHGVLVRYLDEQNFCRVSLCGGGGLGRPPAGLAVQTVVNGQWAEVFRNGSFVPAPGSFYELAAAVVENYLFVRVSPEGAPLVGFGPIDLGGGLNHGQIGLFSWGMTQTAFDWVRVEGIVPLHITDFRKNGDELVFNVINGTGWPFDVEMASAPEAEIWTTVLNAQAASEVRVSFPSGDQGYWRLKKTRP